MDMKKTYQLKDVFSSKLGLRVDTVNGSKIVIFESKRQKGILTYTTDNRSVQDGIEGSGKYLEGAITILRSEALPVAGNEKVVQGDSAIEHVANVYEGVTTYKEAREVLTGEPYGVPVSHLSNSTSIHAKADELGVSFPNLGN